MVQPEEPTMIRRLSPPSDLDQCGYGTLCEVYVKDDLPDIYKQCSEDSNKPDWRLIEFKNSGWYR